MPVKGARFWSRAGEPARANPPRRPPRQPRAHFRLFPGPLASGRFVTAFLECQSSCPLKLLHECRPDRPLNQGGRPAEEHGDPPGPPRACPAVRSIAPACGPPCRAPQGERLKQLSTFYRKNASSFPAERWDPNIAYLSKLKEMAQQRIRLVPRGAPS